MKLCFVLFFVFCAIERINCADNETTTATPQEKSNLIKEGKCPKIDSRQFGQLNCSDENASQCSADSDCEDEEKCCSTGCGHQSCVYPVYTGCQQMRSLLLRQSGSLDEPGSAFIPKCKDSGEFEDVQCHDKIGKCWCVDDLGFELAGTRENSKDLVNCSAARPCAGVLCRMLCPYGFELNSEGCPLCKCRNPCQGIQCPAGQECQLEEIPCAEDVCPPLPTCKQPRTLDGLCPMGTPLAAPENGNPILCGIESNKPQCPPNYLCDVMPGNDYGVCCPLVDKPGTCPTKLHYGDVCGKECEMDMDCEGVNKCCHIENCGKICTKPANTTLCLQQKAVVELLLGSNPRYEGYIPQCRDDGSFSPKQCSVNGHLCWCVTINGTIMSRTMGLAEGVNCEEEQEQAEARSTFSCDEFICDKECEGGYKYNGRGCKICECADPCQDIACPDGLECVLMKESNCLGEYCPPIATCKDKSAFCSWGTPLYNKSTNEPLRCKDSGCPVTHQCETLHGDGICCPKKIIIEATKPQVCPTHIQEPEECDFICTSDSDCEGEMKCCQSKACGAICVPPKPPRLPTMCEYLRDTGLGLEKSGANVSLAVPIPQCLPEGGYSPMQCDKDGECWCVDEFGVEIINTRSNDQSMDCLQIRDQMSCLGLICRLGCDFGFLMDEEGCPLCSCRNPCQNASCGPGRSCQFLEVNCEEDWCPPLPHCVSSEALTRSLPECPVGSPMMFEHEDEPVICDPFSDYPQCPSTHDCVISDPREMGVCCPRISEMADSTHKEGQCPYLIPMQSETCDYECADDSDCTDSNKCCSNGCGTQCVEPIFKTACEHQRAVAEHMARELSIPASHAFLPNCTEDGDFAAVQCNPKKQECWCVDEFGLELPGTRVGKGETITCVPEVDHCPEMNCNVLCTNGYQMDSKNCATCKCYDPCSEFKCKGADETCRLVQVNCITEPCPLMPLCLPKLENPCPIGDPLKEEEAGDVMQCGPHGSHCPSSHRCNLSPFGEYAVCCPKPRVSSCEQLKKKNLNLRKTQSRLTFLPKCNKKTGAWDPTQCMESLGLCWCVDSNGSQLPGTLVRGVPHCTARSGKSLEHTPICQNGKPVHVCPENLCEGKVCLAHPNATCHINPCGGCAAQFMDDFNNIVDCSGGLTACFSEMQDLINGGFAKPEILHADSDNFPLESRNSVEEIFIPPPAYPPPPPPPHLSLDLSHRQVLIDYDYDDSAHLRNYDNYDSQAVDFGIRGAHSFDYPVMVQPRLQGVQLKVMARTVPVLQTMEVQPLVEIVAAPSDFHVMGISRRYTIIDHIDPSLVAKPGVCPVPSLLAILSSIARGCRDECSSDMDCPGYAKCCLYSCGLNCVQPMLPPPTERSDHDGECPAPETVNPLTCLFARRQCSSDHDCLESRKCCATFCGYQCVKTIKSTTREPKFLSVMMQVAVPKCSSEGGYAITQQLGELKWCVDIFGNPFHETLTRGDVDCDANGTIVYQKHRGPVCSDPKIIPRVCKEQCVKATCPQHPEAICLADPCHDCAISFVSVDGTPITCEDKCRQPLTVGNCRGFLPRYHFNQSSNRCEQFIYGGCQGNDNNFETLETCQEECEKKVPMCEQPKNVGLCRAQMFRWFYNKDTHQCEKFVYGGCGGNDNNFETVEECERMCPDFVICPWVNVNGESLESCSRSEACGNATCPGNADARCVVDPCTCQPTFVDKQGHSVSCAAETSEESTSLRTISVSQHTRCESMLKRHLIVGDPSYVPQCDERGEFYPVQCTQEKGSKAHCWCVDEAGMQLPSSSTFPKGTKTCKLIKVQKVEVTLAFKHKDASYSETMVSAIKRLIEQFLKDMKAEYDKLSIIVRPDATHVMFTLLSDNKVQIAFQLEEMVRMQGIFIILPEAEMPVDYRASHFYHILDSKAEVEEVDNSVIANPISSVKLEKERGWATFLSFTVIGVFGFFILIYVVPLIIHRRRQKKGEEPRSSLVGMVFNNITYGVVGKKAADKNSGASEIPKEVIVQTVEAEYETLKKKNDDDKSSVTSEAPPAYEDVDEKDKSEKLEKH